MVTLHSPPPRPVTPEAVTWTSSADTRAVLVWRFPEPRAALSSAPVGGGSAAVDWLANVGVPDAYGREDLEEHAQEVVRRVGLPGTGAALFTAADVTQVVREEEGGVAVDATVGITKPTWAADRDGAHVRRGDQGWEPGTINLVVQLPVALSPSAAVNAVATVTEAKTQALFEAGVPGTGTATDAVVLCWPATLPTERFAGPRSPWGARVALAVHGAMHRGLAGEAP